jgi:hypothetical protein
MKNYKKAIPWCDEALTYNEHSLHGLLSKAERHMEAENSSTLLLPRSMLPKSITREHSMSTNYYKRPKSSLDAVRLRITIKSLVFRVMPMKSKSRELIGKWSNCTTPTRPINWASVRKMPRERWHL